MNMLSWIRSIAVSISLYSSIFTCNTTAYAKFTSDDFLSISREEKWVDSIILLDSEWNSLKVSVFKLRIELGIEQAVRYVSSKLGLTQLVYFQLEDLPIHLLHVTSHDSSLLVVLGQISNNLSVGLASTLSFGSENVMQSAINQKVSDRMSQEFSSVIISQLKRVGIQQVFSFREQQFLLGFVGSGAGQQAFHHFQRILQSDSWVRVKSSHSCESYFQNPNFNFFRDLSEGNCESLMRKNGLTLKINHVFRGQRNLTLIHSDYSG